MKRVLVSLAIFAVVAATALPAFASSTTFSFASSNGTTITAVVGDPVALGPVGSTVHLVVTVANPKIAQYERTKVAPQGTRPSLIPIALGTTNVTVAEGTKKVHFTLVVRSSADTTKPHITDISPVKEDGHTIRLALGAVVVLTSPKKNVTYTAVIGNRSVVTFVSYRTSPTSTKLPALLSLSAGTSKVTLRWGRHTSTFTVEVVPAP
jgi:hypothetical protein